MKMQEGNVFSCVCGLSLSVHGGMWSLPMMHWTSPYRDFPCTGNCPPTHNALTVSILLASCYRPQTKFVKAMFLHVSVSHSVHGGGGSIWAGTHPDRYTPKQVHHPPAGTPTPPGQVHPPGAVHEIRATSGRYASYWNAFLYLPFFSEDTPLLRLNNLVDHNRGHLLYHFSSVI